MFIYFPFVARADPVIVIQLL